MAKKWDYHECIDGIIEEIEKRREVDYAQKTSVRRFNKSYSNCLAYVKYIDKHYPEKIDTLIEMIEEDSPDITLHCAPMILHLENSSHEQKVRAIKAIKRIVNSNYISGADRMGFQISLQKWEAELMSKSS